MNELPDNNGDEARRLVGNVVDDLQAMRAVERDPDSPRRIVCFLAHLVVEKALKAALVDAEVPFRKTHDLVGLYGACRSAERLSGLDVQQLNDLNPWAIDGRYAEELREADPQLAERLARFAAEVVTRLQEELKR